jgi:integrase
MAKKLFTTPIVCKYKNEWFVFFRYWNIETGKYVPKKISRAAGNDLNRIKDLTEREREFNALREAREKWLLAGWNPITDAEFKNRGVVNATQYNDIQHWSVDKALYHALKFIKLAERSRCDYKKSVEYFVDAARPLLISAMEIRSLTRTHVKAVLSTLLQEPFSLSNKNHNKRLCHIKSLLSELEEWKAITENPAFGIKDLAEEKTEKFIPYTDEEREVIKQYLYVTHYRFFVFWATIYYTGVRPEEILSLRICDVNLNKNEIHLKPFSNIVKNRKERFVAIHDDLVRYYKQMNLFQFPDTFYIFSTDFEPGEKKMRRRVVTDLWHNQIKVQLGIDKYMYAGKHSGASAFIKAGASEDTLVDHLGHSSRFITRMYTNEGVEQSKAVIRNTKVTF